MIEAYITNLGKYVEGELCGEYLKLPAEKSDVQALLARIGVDGVLYEETFITDYETEIDGLCKYMGEYESVDELNYLSTLLDEMDDSELEKFTAALEYGEHTSSVKDLINLTQNLDNYELYPGVENEEDLGRYFIDEFSALEVPEHLVNYFDYEAYGRDIHLDGGVFCESGFVEYNHGEFVEHYSGRDDLPDEYKVFAYPDPPDKMPMKEQLAMYAKMITAPAANKQAPVRDERC